MAEVAHSGQSWAQSREKWANIWFEQLCRFHHRKSTPLAEFTADDAIAFLREHLRRKTPAWKRLKIIESLMYFRRFVQKTGLDDLKPIQLKLREIAQNEKLKDLQAVSGDPISDEVGCIDPTEPDVIQELRRAVRRRQDALATERAYVANVRAFMRSRGLKCQADFDSIDSRDIEAYLTDLAVDGNVARSTQNRAFYALLYLFEHVLKREMGEVDAIRSSKGKQIPTVLSVAEIQKIFSHLRDMHLLIAQLLYGTGMRISEALRLRMKDFDFDQRLIEVHGSKGNKSRFVPMPESLISELKRWMQSRRVLHERDLEQGEASVCLPKALERKYPNAAKELKWQFLFASHRMSRDPRTGVWRRHHIHRETFPTQLREAVRKAGIDRHISSHTFRHSFATHLLRQPTDIRRIQELLGHTDVRTTTIYTHALSQTESRVISPLDQMMSVAKVQGKGSVQSEGSVQGARAVRVVSAELNDGLRDEVRLGSAEREDARTRLQQLNRDGRQSPCSIAPPERIAEIPIAFAKAEERWVWRGSIQSAFRRARFALFQMKGLIVGRRILATDCEESESLSSS